MKNSPENQKLPLFFKPDKRIKKERNSAEREILKEQTKNEKSILEEQKDLLSVSEFLDKTNGLLESLSYRICGEIGRVSSRGSYMFFPIKDFKDGSVLNCFAWASVISVCGVKPIEGTEVIVSGIPQIYKPSGQLSFQVKTIELLGEGALKKAFEELKRKLEEEGLFKKEIKKPLEKFPQNIALITSSKGEAINDFNTNIGRFGFKVKLIDARVEGQRAVYDILKALKYFNGNYRNYDTLVIIRGGGSWESLQSFNNEKISRAIRNSKIPVICGVGHEGDVTIADLVSDWRASTPTAAAKKISENWLIAKEEIQNWQNIIISGLEKRLGDRKRIIDDSTWKIESGFLKMFQLFNDSKKKIKNGFSKLKYSIDKSKENLSPMGKNIILKISQEIKTLSNFLISSKGQIKAGSPERNLQLGYSIAFKNKKVIRSVRGLKIKDKFQLKFWDGELKSRIEEIKNK